VSGSAVGHCATVRLRAGQTLRLGRPAAGLRSYLAVRGGIDVPAVLGSRSTDTLSGIGPPPLRAGDVLPVGEDVRGYPDLDVAPVATMTAGPMTLRVTPGPRDDWFRDPRALATGSWAVSSQSNRVGVRLDRRGHHGRPLTRLDDAELPPEGVPLGGIQIPPSGQPVIFLADHPVSGGYPVIGVLRSPDIDLASQARPDQVIRFVIA
jgi:biotin-dependent carboxylase-like uncharacterized protein